MAKCNKYFIKSKRGNPKCDDLHPIHLRMISWWFTPKPPKVGLIRIVFKSTLGDLWVYIPKSPPGDLGVKEFEG